MRMDKVFPRNYPDRVADVLEAMSLSKGKNLIVIGSASLRSILYAGDYDTNESLESLSPAAVAKGLKDVVRRLRKMPNVIVGDIKLGVDANGEEKHWSPGEFLTSNITPFIESGGRRKIDAVALVNGRYVELSTVYQYPDEISSNKEYVEELKADIKEKVKEGDYWKALKRLFSIRRITNPKKADDMIPIFNGEFGLLYQVISDIGVLIYLLELHKGDKKLLSEEISGFKGRLSLIWKNPEFLKKEPAFDRALDKAASNPTDAVKILSHLDKEFRVILQKGAKSIYLREAKKG